jgi:hypothetical protein
MYECQNMLFNELKNELSLRNCTLTKSKSLPQLRTTMETEEEATQETREEEEQNNQMIKSVNDPFYSENLADSSVMEKEENIAVGKPVTCATVSTLKSSESSIPAIHSLPPDFKLRHMGFFHYLKHELHLNKLKKSDMNTNFTSYASKTEETSGYAYSDSIKDSMLKNRSNIAINETEEMRKSVYNFISVPFELEKFLLYGFLICMDAYLFYFTFLPLRLLFGFYQIILRREPLRNAYILDIIRAFSVILAVIFIIWVCDYSQAYHFIRGESTLKLYVMYNMLEVFDKLCCTFGQDIQTSMTLNIIDLGIGSNVERTKMMYLHAIFAIILNIIYIFIHSLVQLFRVITLNVALNSSNNALWTLLVSNNFVELKGSVFKRFGKENLFQLSCGDIVERFQIVIFGLLIFMQNSRAAMFGEAELFSISITLIAEIGVDATKHAFVTRFNNIKAHIYAKFKKKICMDLTNIKNSESFLDNTSQVSHSIGFIEAPLIALSIRVFIQSMPSILPLDSLASLMVYILGYCCLLILKGLLSIVIIGYSSKKLRSI